MTAQATIGAVIAKIRREGWIVTRSGENWRVRQGNAEWLMDRAAMFEFAAIPDQAET